MTLCVYDVLRDEVMCTGSGANIAQCILFSEGGSHITMFYGFLLLVCKNICKHTQKWKRASYHRNNWRRAI